MESLDESQRILEIIQWDLFYFQAGVFIQELEEMIPVCRL